MFQTNGRFEFAIFFAVYFVLAQLGAVFVFGPRDQLLVQGFTVVEILLLHKPQKVCCLLDLFEVFDILMQL